MSTRLKKTILAQAAAVGEILPIIKSVTDGAKEVSDKAQEMSGVNQKGEPVNNGDDFLNDLNLAQQAGREQFSGLGLSPEVYEEYTNLLMKEGMPSRMTAAKFLQDLASIASSASTTLQSVWPAALAIYSRSRTSPERALTILRAIAKYESQAPGLGLFNMAEQAAMGRFDPKALSAVRFSLMGLPGSKGNMNETRDLLQAFDGINLPNSELGEFLDPINMAKQKMQSSQESLLMNAKQYKLTIEKKRNESLKKLFDDALQQLPDWVKNNTGGIMTILQGLSGVVELNQIKNTALDAVGWNGKTGLGNPQHQNTPQMGFLKPQASVVDRIRKTAQAPGEAPVDLNSTPAPTGPTGPLPGQTPTNQLPQPTNEQLATQNVQQSNKGVESDIAKMGYEQGIWDTKTANDVNKLQFSIAGQKSVVDTNYSNLMDMVSAGIAGNSQYSRETASNTPYVTPEQMESYAQSADTSASTLIKLIQSLLTIFVNTAQSVGSSNLSQNKVGVVQFSILMRNIEAKFREQLKEAQQIRIKIFDISVLGTIDQQVRLLEPRYQELKANIDMMASFNNVGADVFVMPFVSVTQEMAVLYFEAAKKYKQASGRIQSEPAMTQYCAQRAKQMEAAGAKARAEGVIALRNLMKQQGGTSVASLNNKFVRLAEETSLENEEKNVLNNEDEKEVEAKPMTVDKYWDELYDDNPPYGDVIVHPEKHRNEPSWKIKKHQIKRLD